MGLRAFVTMEDKYIISSVGAEGKRTRELKKLKRKNASHRAIYTLPCEDHNSPHPTVSVELLRFGGLGQPAKGLGIARVCPLCWEILAPPEKAP